MGTIQRRIGLFLLGILLLVSLLTVILNTKGQERIYDPEIGLRSGEELGVVFIGAKFCQAHREPGFRELVEHMKVLLAERAARDSMAISVRGIALDWSIGDGIEFLESFGRFDQVSVGENWLNIGAMRYIWSEFPGHPAVPQVLVLKRLVEVKEGGIAIEEERLLKRVVGTDEIRRWVEQGAPI